ncbi:MAG: hypothetical protein A2808_02240 [Candidatus Moranbacteria bacterium RIFCSPHIGHO2_01_FULL_55_24]|nr:MAG: hypothetical protein A2808_02240 [Candidatus Moranbacteria bacterium RIFCSPHIGHO2_01_FULL_55_24]
MAQIGFTRKKVSTLTLGEKLSKLRSDFRISLSEISKATKIQVRYLEHLEKGEYDKLPADVYVRGFLRSYARYLNVDEHALMKLYDRERNIKENLKGPEEKNVHDRNVSLSSLVITPRTILLACTGVLVLGVFAYLYQEFRSFAAEPRLVILEPEAGSVVETSEATLRGKTDKGARVSVNGKAAFVGSEGEFSEKLTLQQGLNTIVVVSINRFEKEKTETLLLEARFAQEKSPDSSELAAKIDESERFSLEVRVEESVTVSIVADGTTVQSGRMEPGISTRVEAKERIVISSDNGAKTLVRPASGTETALAPDPGPVKGAVFTRSGREEEEKL